MSYTVDKVDINGKKMGYMHFGTVGKPIVVMIPGLSIQSVLNSAAAIEKQYAQMAESFDFYLFDRKENVELGYSIEDMAKGINGAWNNDLSVSGSPGRSIVMNIYGAEGQDVSELAEIVSQKIAFEYDVERRAFA